MNIDPKLASVILKTRTAFNSYLTKSATYPDENLFSEDEFSGTDDSLKGHKAPGFDKSLVNAIKPTYTIK